MAKPTAITKIGIVRLTEIGCGSWRFRYKDPSTGKDIRRIVSGLSRSEAKEVAATISAKSLSESGYLPGKRTAIPTLKEALSETIRLSKQRVYVRKDSTRRAALFVRWLKDQYPRVETFDQLKPMMVQSYVTSMEASGLALDTIKNHLKPIKAAWRYMAENYPDQVRPLPRIRISKEKKNRVESLNAKEVSLLLDWFEIRVRKGERKYFHLWPIAALQALCGLRMLEAAALRIQDIDFQEGTITITETPWHIPKTHGSYRTIAACSEVLEILRVHIDGMRVIPSTGELFMNRYRRVWGAAGLSRIMGLAMREAAKRLDCPRLGQVQPHTLRASFATTAARLGVPDRICKAHLGHSGTDILTRHYQGVGEDELRSVSVVFEGWRTLAKDPVSGKILASLRGEVAKTPEKSRLRVV